MTAQNIDNIEIAPGYVHKETDTDFNSFKKSASCIEKDDANSDDPAVVTECQNSNKNRNFAAPKDFELLRVIGMGAFGKVLQVRLRGESKNENLAMKIISKRLIRKKTSYVQNIKAERDILTKVSHPFIVKLHCSFQTREKLFLVMDFCSGGELFLKIGREGLFLEKDAAFFLAEIILALEHLHGLGILHRDLKPENILLHSDGHIALTDFGLSKDFSSKTDEHMSPLELSRANTVCGTTEYMAPEMIARKGYGKPADFWSLGCIAYEMLSGKAPFTSNKGTKDLFHKILNERLRMPVGSSAAACRMLKGLLNRDASKRLGAAKGTMFQVGGVAELKNIDFFSKIGWHLLESKQIDPPFKNLDQTLDDKVVENGNELVEDMNNFHDEFTKMTLPRSVKEMSEIDYKQKRCDSKTFSGFSFVMEDFDLPEKSDFDVDYYWNNVDTDGISASDCASSVAIEGGEEGLPTSPELQANIASSDNTGEKKKRPPRKKKKKKEIINDDGSNSQTTIKSPLVSKATLMHSTNALDEMKITLDDVMENNKDSTQGKEESKNENLSKVCLTQLDDYSKKESEIKPDQVGAKALSISSRNEAKKSSCKVFQWEKMESSNKVESISSNNHHSFATASKVLSANDDKTNQSLGSIPEKKAKPQSLKQNTIICTESSVSYNGLIRSKQNPEQSHEPLTYSASLKLQSRLAHYHQNQPQSIRNESTEDIVSSEKSSSTKELNAWQQAKSKNKYSNDGISYKHHYSLNSPSTMKRSVYQTKKQGDNSSSLSPAAKPYAPPPGSWAAMVSNKK